ncbi:MAG: transporter substrate-binding domain-containing protein [Acutalibacteraceae bacterium]
MKKIISGILALTMLCSAALSLTACGSSSGSSSSSTTAKVQSIDDLKNVKIGVQLGTTGDLYATDCEEDGCTIDRYNKGADAVLALTQNKVDCVIIDNEPAKAFVAANKGLKILDEPFAEEEYAICVAKNNTELRDNINKALKELKEDGTVDKIINNFIGDDTKGKSPYETPAGTDTSKGELHMATNAAFEPYEYQEGGKVVGIDAMLAQAICDKLGYKLVIDDMDFDAIITAVQSGKADFGMAGMTVTEEREKSINFTDTYTKAKQVIIVKE